MSRPESLLLAMVLGHAFGVAGALLASTSGQARRLGSLGAIVGASSGLALGLDTLLSGAPLRVELPWLLDLAGGVSAYHVTDGELGLELTGFASAGLRGIAGIGRVQLDGDAGRIDFVDWVGGGGALGADLVRDRLDVSARYHLTLLRYAASVEDGLEHRAGARAHLSLASTDLALDGELVRGAGADAVIALLSAVWRLP